MFELSELYHAKLKVPDGSIRVATTRLVWTLADPNNPSVFPLTKGVVKAKAKDFVGGMQVKMEERETILPFVDTRMDTLCARPHSTVCHNL